MKLPQPTVTRVAEVPAVPWRNGGGVTRELLAWPDPQDWVLRVSVADIAASGPFSGYPGVDRWFAVLEGGALRLDTAGSDLIVLSTSDPDLHAFSGDAATNCTALGPVTRDFNLMVRRARARSRQQALQRTPQLDTHAEGAGLFVVHAVELIDGAGAAQQLPAMACAWWPNPRRERRTLRVEAAYARGWWFEVDTDWSRAL